MAYVEVDGDVIIAVSEFRERDLIRQVPGFKWDPQRKQWKGPLSWASCVVLRGVFGTSLQIGPLLTAWATNERATRVDPCRYIRGATETPWPDTDVQVALDAWEAKRA